MSRGATRNIPRRNEGVRGLSAIAMVAIVLACPLAWTQQPASAGAYSPSGQPKGKSFSKPEDAASAIYAAAKRNDESELLAILGPNSKELIHWTDDANELQQNREMFAKQFEQMHRLVKEPDNTVALYVGSENWPLPIPLIEFQGAWYFDAELGQQEVRYRRIGANEMEALEVCRALVDAEKDYRVTALKYTAKFVSSENSHDGLYWKSEDNTPKSPIGPYLAHAGVTESDASHFQPFHGYLYRILLEGSDTIAILAFPAEYRSSGVMTFIVSEDGRGYERDLGEQTPALSKQISSSGRDSSWKQVE